MPLKNGGVRLRKVRDDNKDCMIKSANYTTDEIIIGYGYSSLVAIPSHLRIEEKRLTLLYLEMKSQNGSANRDPALDGCSGKRVSAIELTSIVEIPVIMDLFFKDKCGECETKNLRIMDCSDHECHELQMSFQGTKKFPCVKAKKCGVRIIYEKDLEEIKEVQCHTTQSSPNFEHIHHHSTDKDGSADSTSLVKRKLYLNLCQIATFEAILSMNSPNITTDQSAFLALNSHVTHDTHNLLITNWSNSISICNRIGVTCGSKQHRVTTLNLSRMDLA
ncbi:hypothetical protein Goari_027192, partial [Gossypium aridum]|nr:hypothetical protein [Gossypium aridum]